MRHHLHAETTGKHSLALCIAIPSVLFQCCNTSIMLDYSCSQVCTHPSLDNSCSRLFTLCPPPHAFPLATQVTAAERAAVEPPKLGKHKFEAAPVAVLTSDEVTGSLRQIKVRTWGMLPFAVHAERLTPVLSIVMCGHHRWAGQLRMFVCLIIRAGLMWMLASVCVPPIECGLLSSCRPLSLLCSPASHWQQIASKPCRSVV